MDVELTPEKENIGNSVSVSYTTETLPSIVGQVVPTKSESMKYRIKGADYYIDCKDDCPIPTTVDRIVIEKGSRAWAGLFFAFSVLMFSAFVTSAFQGESSLLLTVATVATVVFAFVGIHFLPRKNFISRAGFEIGGFLSTKHLPWPTSRTSFFVHDSRTASRLSASSRQVQTLSVKLISDAGKQIPLGISFTGPNTHELERQAVIQCSRIWDWGVARGFTADSGDYVALNGLGKPQVLRMRQEDRYGLR